MLPDACIEKERGFSKSLLTNRREPKYNKKKAFKENRTLRIKLAKTAGFCKGVRRAMNIVLDTANKKKENIFTSPLIFTENL